MSAEWLEKEAPEGWLKLGAAAELSQKYAADQRDFFHRPVLLLQSALLEETAIEQHGGLFARKTLHWIFAPMLCGLKGTERKAPHNKRLINRRDYQAC